MKKSAKRVYLVTSSEEDGRYIVEYCFTSKSKANYVQKLFCPHGSVEAINLDEMPSHPIGTRPYRFIFDSSGGIVRSEAILDSYNFPDESGNWNPIDWGRECNDLRFTCIKLWSKGIRDAANKAKKIFAELTNSGKLKSKRSRLLKLRNRDGEAVRSGVPNPYPLAINTMPSVSKE